MGGLTGAGLTEPQSAVQLLRRPEVTLRSILELPLLVGDERAVSLRLNREVLERVEIEVKYEGYLKRQQEQIEAFERSEHAAIPDGFDFGAVKSLSKEGREKLEKVRPRSIGQASRIGGVTASDLSVLMVSLRR
jgi:tRNA uridine 5-carboxymethylaminomethyl modification enzyme